MKKTFFSLLLGIVCTLVNILQTEAQSLAMVPKSNIDLFRKTTSGQIMLNNSHNLSMENIPHKTIKNFGRTFKSNSEVWLKTKEGFCATFKSEKGSKSVYYNKKGPWTYELETYQEEKLDKDIRIMIKKEYYDYKILKVYEINSNIKKEDPTYIVVIKGDTNYKWIRINNEGMNVYKQFDIAN